jgi:hypothetical protein
MSSPRRNFTVCKWRAAITTLTILGCSAVPFHLAVGDCQRLYTDDQALALIKATEAAVPKGEFRRKPTVMKSLGIDIHRLCHRRFQQINLGATEAWQMSPNYDLTWWAAGPDRFPLDSENALIHHVRIVHR